MTMRTNPPGSKIIKWTETSFPYERIHVDFLGPINNKNFLIITDAYTKWPEIFEMKSIDSTNTIIKLRETFARFGLPQI